MLRYEILLLTIPEITQDESSAIEAQVQAIVREHKGTMLSFERWGKMLLAYPVQDKDYGVYFLARFEIAEQATALLEALKMLLAVKLNETVMRYMVNRLDEAATLEYQRPESLEDTPARSEGFREGRMRSDRGSYAASSEGADISTNNDYQAKETHGQES